MGGFTIAEKIRVDSVKRNRGIAAANPVNRTHMFAKERLNANQRGNVVTGI